MAKEAPHSEALATAGDILALVANLYRANKAADAEIAALQERVAVAEQALADKEPEKVPEFGRPLVSVPSDD